VTHNTAAAGGGIANSGRPSSILILSSHIDKNMACDTFSNGVCIGYGKGGGIWEDGENLTIDGSTVNGNVAGAPAYDNGDGGGIYAENDAFQIRNSFVYNNVAGEYGGGMYVNEHADIVNTEIVGNLAGEGGGGIDLEYLLTLKHSQLKNNTAGGTFACTINGLSTTCQQQVKTSTGTCASLYPSATNCTENDGSGGGLYSNYEYPELISSNITGNLAVSISGDATNCGGGNGGGIWTKWTLTMLKTTRVMNNTADCGGGIYNGSSQSGTYLFQLADSLITGNKALEDGGGLWTHGIGTGMLYGMTITGNTAGRQTGGVWSDGIGSVIFGVGNNVTKNTSKGACKNVLWPCS
jgi:hypothetical protein